jgi:hypothetical protein
LADQDPIKQLQSFLNDRGNVLERISGIHAMLDSLKAPVSSGANTETLPHTAPAAAPPSENPYDRPVHMLREIQAQIENQVRPLAQQAIDLEVERLRGRAAIDQGEFRACLDRIDQCVSACIERAHEYQREHAELARFNERFTALVEIAEPLPECPSNITDIINSRLELLRRQQRL